MLDCSTVYPSLVPPPCRLGLYKTVFSAFRNVSVPVSVWPFQLRSGIAHSHLSGASSIAEIMRPNVDFSSLGATTGLSRASTAAVASSAAPFGSWSREYCFAHADSRRRAA